MPDSSPDKIVWPPQGCSSSPASSSSTWPFTPNWASATSPPMDTAFPDFDPNVFDLCKAFGFGKDFDPSQTPASFGEVFGSDCPPNVPPASRQPPFQPNLNHAFTFGNPSPSFGFNFGSFFGTNFPTVTPSPAPAAPPPKAADTTIAASPKRPKRAVKPKPTADPRTNSQPRLKPGPKPKAPKSKPEPKSEPKAKPTAGPSSGAVIGTEAPPQGELTDLALALLGFVRTAQADQTSTDKQQLYEATRHACTQCADSNRPCVGRPPIPYSRAKDEYRRMSCKTCVGRKASCSLGQGDVMKCLKIDWERKVLFETERKNPPKSAKKRKIEVKEEVKEEVDGEVTQEVKEKPQGEVGLKEELQGVLALLGLPVLVPEELDLKNTAAVLGHIATTVLTLKDHKSGLLQL